MLQVRTKKTIQNDLSGPSQQLGLPWVLVLWRLCFYMWCSELHSSRTGHISVQYCMIQQERIYNNVHLLQTNERFTYSS